MEGDVVVDVCWGDKEVCKRLVAQKILGLIWKAMTGVATLTISVFFSSACRKVLRKPKTCEGIDKHLPPCFFFASQE